MRLLRWILLVAILVMAISFSLLNATEVEFHYYIGSINLPLSYLLFASMLLGIVIGILVMLGPIIKLRCKVWQLNRNSHKAASQNSAVIKDLAQ